MSGSRGCGREFESQEKSFGCSILCPTGMFKITDYSEMDVAESSRFRSCDLHCGRRHHAHRRIPEHVSFRGPDDGALRLQNRRGVAGRSRSWACQSLLVHRTTLLPLIAAMKHLSVMSRPKSYAWQTELFSPSGE